MTKAKSEVSIVFSLDTNHKTPIARQQFFENAGKQRLTETIAVKKQGKYLAKRNREGSCPVQITSHASKETFSQSTRYASKRRASSVKEVKKNGKRNIGVSESYLYEN